MVSSEQLDRVDALEERCVSLLNRMAIYPDRPSWQIEFCSILQQLTEVLKLLSSTLASTSLNLDDISRRVAVLENRYSELLYQLSASK